MNRAREPTYYDRTTYYDVETGEVIEKETLKNLYYEIIKRDFEPYFWKKADGTRQRRVKTYTGVAIRAKQGNLFA